MGKKQGKSRVSRCCVPQQQMMTWHDHVDPEHPSVVALDEWLASLPTFARAHEEGEIDALFEAAAYGELWESADASTPIKPIHYHPDVYELRRKALKKALRFYHGEPEKYPRHLIKLHRHIKTSAKLQQIEIEYAASRYEG